MIGDTTFEFDPLISPENRFIQFKASNIGRVLNMGPEGDDDSEEDELNQDTKTKTGSLSDSLGTGRSSKSKKSEQPQVVVSSYIRKQALLA